MQVWWWGPVSCWPRGGKLMAIFFSLITQSAFTWTTCVKLGHIGTAMCVKLFKSTDCATIISCNYLWLCVTFIFLDPPKMQIATASSLTSWVGLTVTLKCQSDGVLTSTLTWYQPDGNEIFRVTQNKETTDQVGVNDNYFGHFKCVAENGLTPPDEKINKIKNGLTPPDEKINKISKKVTLR